MKILIIDNFDSFTYNLYQVIGEILSSQYAQNNFSIKVIRNNELTLDEIKTLAPDKIIISPGPGSPDDDSYFGVCASVILELGKTIPLLGVCLGMQGITHVFGGNVVKAKLPMHGKISTISHNGAGLFKNIPNYIEIMRYHSLVAEPASLPVCLKVTAIVERTEAENIEQILTPGSDENLMHLLKYDHIEIMGIEHIKYPIYGVQYHPESFASEAGKELIANFIFM
ncbi:MAG: aminodeoxychorismate/anthranilate synthase component II [Marinagarivorans sp.]|nr:aminodeoxychorismate/anthranilate synthase component II [Marinagarivorans sp.]